MAPVWTRGHISTSSERGLAHGDEVARGAQGYIAQTFMLAGARRNGGRRRDCAEATGLRPASEVEAKVRAHGTVPRAAMLTLSRCPDLYQWLEARPRTTKTRRIFFRRAAGRRRRCGAGVCSCQRSDIALARVCWNSPFTLGLSVVLTSSRVLLETPARETLGPGLKLEGLTRVHRGCSRSQ